MPYRLRKATFDDIVASHPVPSDAQDDQGGRANSSLTQ
jgi:hypothetical protein